MTRRHTTHSLVLELVVEGATAGIAVDVEFSTALLDTLEGSVKLSVMLMLGVWNGGGGLLDALLDTLPLGPTLLLLPD